MKNKPKGALGQPTARMATLWVPLCITIDVKMFFILATASERIVDTLEFFPHNSPMPQLSSTDRLIMAANDMVNALKQPHPEVPFSHVGDNTITALTQLVEIFKNKFQKPKSPELSHSPTKAAKNKRPVALTQPLLNSPMQHKYQTSSQRPILTATTINTPLLPRVVTPMTGLQHLRGCRREHKIFLREICHKMISGAWKHPTWTFPWEPIIGPNNNLPMQWYIQSPEIK
jgi:hypothetical protein